MVAAPSPKGGTSLQRPTLRQALLLTLMCGDGAALPKCTYDSCPKCFEDGLSGENVSLPSEGKVYSLPFRIGRPDTFWTSHSIMAEVLGFLMREKLGIAVEYVHCADEAMCMRGMLNFADWWQGGTSQHQPNTAQDALDMFANGSKLFPDPFPDIFVAVEIWPGALTQNGLGITDSDVWENRETLEIGPLGIILQNGLYVFPDMANLAWAHEKLVLTNYLMFQGDDILRYLSTPRALNESGYGQEEPGCPGDGISTFSRATQNAMDLLAEMGYICREGWWLTPACDAYGAAWWDWCIAIFDDDWGYMKPDMFKALLAMNGPLAKVTLGYEIFFQAVTSLKFNATVLWWNTDVQFRYLHLERVALPPGYEASVQIVRKVSWNQAYTYKKMSQGLLSELMINNQVLDEILDLATDAMREGNLMDAVAQPGVYSKLACDWIRADPLTWTAWLPSDKSCGLAEFLNPATLTCQPCLPGTFYDRVRGASKCLPCSQGRIRSEPGGLVCQMCAAGLFQSMPGQTECRRCTMGHYSYEGATICTKCPGDLTTEYPASSNPVTECLCPAGTYRDRHARTTCRVCPPGMICGFGADQVKNPNVSKTVMPEVLDGTMVSQVGSTLNVFRCSLDTAFCHGNRRVFLDDGELNLEGQCGLASAGLACGRCLPEFYLSKDRCLPCSGLLLNTRIRVLVATLCCIVLGCATLFHRAQFPPEPSGMAVGTIITFMQAITVVGTFSIEFPITPHSTIKTMSFLQLNLGDMGLPGECSMGSDFALRFAFRVCWPCWFWGGFFVVFAATRVFHRLGTAFTRRYPMDASRPGRPLSRFETGFIWANDMYDRWSQVRTKSVPFRTKFLWYYPMKTPDLINALVKTHNAFFIVITSTSTALFSVEGHPCELWTVKSYPDVLYGSEQWWSAVPVSVAGMAVFCGGFLAFILYLVVVAPRRVASDPIFRQCFRGLWAKFDTTAWWFGIVHLIYGLILNLLPVFIRNAKVQVIIAVLLNASYILVVCHLLPWKYSLNHWADLVSKIGLTGFILVSTAGKSGEPIDENTLGILMIISGGLPILVISGMLGKHLWYAKVAHAAKFGIRAEFAQRLHDIVAIVGSKSTLELRAYALELSDNDAHNVCAALDTLQFTVLGLQTKSPRTWRAAPLPFDVAVDGRLEGEMKARGVLSKQDARVELREVRAAVTEMYASLNSLHTKRQQSTNSISKSYLKALFVEADTSGDGQLSEDEFVDLLLRRLDGVVLNSGSMITREGLLKLFKFIDINQSGSLSVHEFIHAMYRLPEPVYPKWYTPAGTYQGPEERAEESQSVSEVSEKVLHDVFDVHDAAENCDFGATRDAKLHSACSASPLFLEATHTSTPSLPPDGAVRHKSLPTMTKRPSASMNEIRIQGLERAKGLACFCTAGSKPDVNVLQRIANDLDAAAEGAEALPQVYPLVTLI